MDITELKMFVCGNVLIHKMAQDSLIEFCEQYMKDRYQLEIIDVSKEPWKAEDYKIIATPTVIISSPEGEKRVLGDLSDHTIFLTILKLNIEGNIKKKVN